MKKIFTISLLILISLYLFSEIDYQTRGDNLIISYRNLQKDTSDIYKVIAFPTEKISIKILEIDVQSFDNEDKPISRAEIDYNDFIAVKDNFIMRELYGHKILIKNKVKFADGYSLLNSLSFQISATSEIKHITKISKAFLPAYKALADNFRYSYLRNVDFSNPRMLIISHSSLSQYVDVYKTWKQQKGTDVMVANIEDIGSSSTDLKDYILEQYNSDTPPDYLLLIGDVDGSYVIPSYYITAENDVTDQIYTELEGDDYFPEMIIGRFSIDQPSEFITMINKVLHYEKTPYLDETDWLKHTVVVAGNYSPSPPYPSTPVATSQWMADNFRAHGFTDVTEIYYPPTYPGTSEIHAAINQGAAFVTYRGWGDANGWHFPEYHIGEGTETGVIDLTNGYKLPIVTSMVCHTGDFANTLHDPCFGEAWLRAGTPTNPKGGVVFVGPSDLHTHTKFNNAIYGGFYQGVLDEGIYDFGAAVLRGKIELYNNFPLNQAPGGLVEFYFRVYNIIGDANIQMWTDIPQAITCDTPSEIGIGTNSITLELPNLDGAIVTAVKDNEDIFSKAIVQNGSATLYFNLTTTGTLTVTVTHPNRVPYIVNIPVVQNAVDLGITNIETENGLLSGATSNINITLKNFGTQTGENISATLTSNDDFVTIDTPTQNFGNIPAGSTASQTYQVTISGDCPDNHSVEFELNTASSTSKFCLIVNGLSFVITGYQVDNSNGYISPGETAQITFHLKNSGTFTTHNLQIEATGTNAFTFNSNSFTIDEIDPNQTVDMSFNVSVAADCYVGRILGFNFAITDDNGRTTTAWYHVVAGDVTNTAPTGPDNFGYYAYDSFDTQYAIAPEYSWIEIDPSESGSGTLIEMEDDQTETLDLPFTFKYYNQNYNQLSVCSNGWISFVPTEQVNFINWNIPGALGPYAMVAPYWDDLIGEDLGNDQNAPMNISYLYDSDNHKFIIEWNKCYSRFDETSPQNFELILFDPNYYSTPDGNGMIQFNYATVSNPDANNNYATVGIENHLQNDGVLYTFASQYPASATPLQDNLSILFTTIKPDNYTFSQDDILSANKAFIINNYPNPFNPQTNISYMVKNKKQHIELSIYNLKGEKIITLVNSQMNPGLHKVVWNGKNRADKNVSSGVYFITLKAESKTLSIKKGILLK